MTDIKSSLQKSTGCYIRAHCSNRGMLSCNNNAVLESGKSIGDSGSITKAQHIFTEVKLCM